MKKIILLLLLASFSVYCQNKPKELKVSTTQEEYNYLTKGYKIQITSGLDTKKGYEIKPIVEIQKGNYVFNFLCLIRSKEQKSVGILIVANSLVSDNSFYIAIPVNNTDLELYYEMDVNAWDESLTTAYALASSEFFSRYFFDDFNDAKTK